MTVEAKPGDVVRLRKARPCGCNEWGMVKVGTDMGLKCLKCQRRVLMARDVLRRRLKDVTSETD